MILGEINRASGITTTLDDLFRRAGVRHPDALALVDPPNRASFTDGPPRTLSYAQADHAISALAARLRGFGLQTDAVVAIQLPNTVESVIACLAVLRAGMIAAPLPLLWRRRDLVDALGRVSAKAILTCARAGNASPADAAMHTAAALFPIRHICGFGQNLPDGVVSIDDVFAPGGTHGSALPSRPDSAASHLAAITFDIDARGANPVARNHIEVISGGLAVYLELGITLDACLLSTIPLSSFAGVALTLAPWLLSGGTLHLHHGFDPAAFDTQYGATKCSILALPATVLPALAEAGMLANEACTIAALWRGPERASAAKSFVRSAVVDVFSFGETGFVAARRTEHGKPAPIPHGVISAPRGAIGAMTVVETSCSNAGTLMLRGPMVPSTAFSPGPNPGRAPSLIGFADTGFACRLDKQTQTLAIAAPPSGVVGIGGYRLRQSDIDVCVEKAAAEAAVVLLPDRTLGHRLAGTARDKKAVAITLDTQGVNALISGAFRQRGNAA
jgi:AMP-binding enzyme